MTEPKLLTEAEVLAYFKHNPCADVAAIIESFRERGLIAPEPVDPLLVEAREIAAVNGRWVDPEASSAKARAGELDENHRVVIALAALRRGMELAERKELTREIVQDALFSLHRFPNVTPLELHAALVERLK